MICTPQALRATAFVLFTCVVFAFSGCDPSADKQPESGQSNSAGNGEGSVAEPSGEAPSTDSGESTSDSGEAANGVTTISGDLAEVDWESMIGKQVSISGDLVIVDNYDLVRRGQVKVARNRLYVPTVYIDPNDPEPGENSFEGGSNVKAIAEAKKKNSKATLILDDGSAKQNIFPPTLFSEIGTVYPSVRVGSVVHGVSGELVKAGKNILLVVDGPINWTPAERPERPEMKGADAVVASFNVLNYFTTIDNGSNGARGADSDAEFKRQEDKLVSAIVELDADVIGLMELENNLAAEKQLVQALNKKLGKDVYKGCGLPDGFSDAPGGTNAIRVGMIYRSEKVEPLGSVSMIKDDAFFGARTPIVQRFKSKDGGSFTVVVNHFKSKGGSDRADAANKDKGDGQGGYNAARRAQALAICNYIDGLKEEKRVLVMGDLNAYQQEDPIDAMRSRGLVDLHERFGSTKDSTEQKHYSYIYYGQSGSLDHAMATEALVSGITGIETWHINADEPRFMDYNQEYNPKSLYRPDSYRSSDHDPVLIGIRN